MEIEIYDQTNQVEQAIFKQTTSLLDLAANFLKLPKDTLMSVTFVDNKKIQEINRNFRKIDRPTDVISFALEDSGVGEEKVIFSKDDIADFPRDLGDIFISLEQAKKQAQDYGHSFERELGFLTIHGFLHLNGYDHQNFTDEKNMFALQEEILTSYGLERK